VDTTKIQASLAIAEGKPVKELRSKDKEESKDN
jgi:hypothetical protein